MSLGPIKKDDLPNTQHHSFPITWDPSLSPSPCQRLKAAEQRQKRMLGYVVSEPEFLGPPQEPQRRRRGSGTWKGEKEVHQAPAALRFSNRSGYCEYEADPR